LVALGASSNLRLARAMLYAYSDGKADASTLLQTDTREGTAFRPEFEQATEVVPLLHSRMFTKNHALWDAAGVDAQTDSHYTIAKKLAVYEDAAGRDWTQLMQPLTMAEAKAVWTDVYRFGSVKFPEQHDVGLAELATNNYIRVIGDHVYPLCAMRIVVDRAPPASYISEPALRPHTMPGDTRAQAEARKEEKERKGRDVDLILVMVGAFGVLMVYLRLRRSAADSKRSEPEEPEELGPLQKEHYALEDARYALEDARYTLKDARYTLEDARYTLKDARYAREEARAARAEVQDELLVRILTALADRL
jgi:hypothetical protein